MSSFIFSDKYKIEDKRKEMKKKRNYCGCDQRFQGLIDHSVSGYKALEPALQSDKSYVDAPRLVKERYLIR